MELIVRPWPRLTASLKKSRPIVSATSTSTCAPLSSSPQVAQAEADGELQKEPPVCVRGGARPGDGDGLPLAVPGERRHHVDADGE